MLSFSGSLKVLVAVEPCDMRKGFNGLHALVTERLGEDPRQGTLFVNGSVLDIDILKGWAQF
jgi:transposase